MNKIIIASTRESAGKTSIIVGLNKALGKKTGYIKPFGDRLIYRRKKNWDYDASLLVQILGIDEEPESISLGFNHAKLRYVYDQESTMKAVVEMADNIGKGKDLLFVEGGKDLAYGASIDLDSISLARYLKAKLVVVTSGDSDSVYDDIRHLKKNHSMEGVNFGGVIANKVPDVDDFEASIAGKIRDMGVNLLGVIPYKEQLTFYAVSFLAERLFAKVIAGEKGLNNVVKNIFVGAMSTEESMRNPLFNKENKFLITSGDRSDMILAAIESDSIGILLTNNILPPANIVSKAADKNIPLLLVPMDTFEASKKIDRLEALPTKENTAGIQAMAQLVEKYVKLEELVK
ncbi:MAG TPA: DRTGG domain-containing protein [Spirochaetota bacterium]|nr:DRTGG domain-containing protein [Spirochaetota bacterium]